MKIYVPTQMGEHSCNLTEWFFTSTERNRESPASNALVLRYH